MAKTRGVRGELLADGFGQDAERFSKLSRVTLFRGDEAIGEFRLMSAAPYRGRWIVKLAGVDDMDRAGEFRGCEICVPLAERPPVEPGEYYLPDLIGCRLVDRATGEVLGVVDSWQEYGGGTVLVSGTLEVPFARAICVEIDIEGRRIAVDLPEGLKDLNKR